jgi:hypothetical protein
MCDEWVRREAALTDLYYRQQRHMRECEIAASLDEAERIAKRAEQSRMEGQLDLYWRTGP